MRMQGLVLVPGRGLESHDTPLYHEAQNNGHTGTLLWLFPRSDSSRLNSSVLG
jgi:hypothetical protein